MSGKKPRIFPRSLVHICNRWLCLTRILDADTGNLLWYHALAIGYSPAYLSENADGIRTDYPRIPLPATADDLKASATLGKRVAALLNTEVAVTGVTGRTGVSAALLTVATLTRTDGAAINPDTGDLSVNAGWGNATKKRGNARTRQGYHTDLHAC